MANMSPQAALDRFYAAEAQYSADPSDIHWKTLADCIDREFVLYQADSLPYGGEWRGRDGSKDWMRAMAESWVQFKVEEPRVIFGDDSVVAVVKLIGEARRTGRKVEMPLTQVIRIRDGRLLEVRPFYWDTAAINATLGHEPTAESQT